jgi:HEAT repeat protein
MRVGRKKIVWSGFIILAAILLCVVCFRRPARNEPMYQGKTLTQWLTQLDDGEVEGISSGSLPTFTRAQIEAGEAIRAMGTNALPLLIVDIHAHPSEAALRFRLFRLLHLNGMGMSFGPRNYFSTDVTSEDRTRWRAAQGLSALGPLAKPAIPELTRLLFTNYFHSSIKEAAYALAGMGPDGIAVLTNAPGRDEWSGMCAIWALGQHPAAGTNVMPFLISATTSSSEGTACGAIQVLGLFHTDAEHVVPALTNALSSSNAAVRGDAARALGKFGVQGTKN